jgi:YD repeat-containing protein
LPTGLVWRFDYGDFGRLKSVTNPNGKTQASYTYDAFDRVKTTTDSEGYKLTYSYDAADRVTEILYPDGTTFKFDYTFQPGAVNVGKPSLDLRKLTDRLGRVTTFNYDADRRLTEAIDPLKNITRYDYWENGALKSLTDPKGHVTSWTIDVQGRPNGKEYPDGSQVAYGYDISGRLETVTDALRQVRHYAYTVDDRLAEISYDNAVNHTPKVAFAYDPSFPRLTTMGNGAGPTNYAYFPVGALGALKLESETGPEGKILYAYDALGRTISRNVSGQAETFGYDALNRLTDHIDPLGHFKLTYLGETGQITSRAQTNRADYPAETAWSYLPNINDRRLSGIANAGMRTFSFTTTPEDVIQANCRRAQHLDVRV